ncbi:MAG: DUF4837 family protein [Rikenellaceae bacterium]
MKKITTLLVAVVALFAIVGCDALHTVSENKVVSQGSPYELVVVSNQPQWDGELGDSLRAVFTAPIPYLQQTEPLYDVIRVTERGYTNLVTRHRNIFRTLIEPTLDSASVAVQYDLISTPQVVLTLQGPTEESLTEYLSEHRAQVISALEMAERDRALSHAKQFGIKGLEGIVKEKFGFEMHIPTGYLLRNQGDDFLWMSFEYPTASQGVIIYKYPAVEGVKSLTATNLTKARNKFVAKVPGPSDGSYMTTFTEVEPDYRLIRLNGRIWAEMRGFWDVAGDFMGGPFVSYSTIDIQTGEVVTIDAYVYSPKLGKRNFMRGVEHLIHNVNFPAPSND